MERYIALQKIIELGSFTKVADALGYTQSAISQMIASLENEHGFRLLVRSRTGVSLSQEGKKLYPSIQKAIFSYQSIQEKVNEIKGVISGVIRVGTISSITVNWMPYLISHFKQRYPDVDFLFHQGDYTSIQEWIKTGEVDFGFLSPDAVTGLETIPLMDGEMMVILSKEHPLACKKSINLESLVNEPFILLEEGHYSEPMEAFEKAGLKPHVQYRVHDDYAIMAMVEAKLGVSILADLILKRVPFDIVKIPVEPRLYRHLAIGYKNKDSLPLASQYFIDFIISHKDELLR